MSGAPDASIAVVAKRADAGPVDTAEIERLVQSAGYEVGGVVTQTRTADPALEFGEGKVSELVSVVERTGATAVVFDNRLGPYQTYNLGTRLPDGVAVKDRYRLVLDIFGQRAQTRKAQLQVELAELRYELPRVEAKSNLANRDERPGFMGLGEYEQSREEDIKAQISHIRDELDDIEQVEADRRDQRRSSGFDLVALAGYTNAGKSTLMRALADDLTIDENERRHSDLDTTAESEDRLFTTLGTTTRRADIDRRDVLVTDTVGFISDLPHWLVESFKSTLGSVYQSDLVLLVVDASESVQDIREKLVTAHDTLYERNEAPIVTVLNKIDRISETELQTRKETLSGLAPDPVAISAREGVNLETLRERIVTELPARQRERLVLPITDETMSVVSWVHDNAYVREVDWGVDEVIIDFEANQDVVERSRAKATELTV